MAMIRFALALGLLVAISSIGSPSKASRIVVSPARSYTWADVVFCAAVAEIVQTAIVYPNGRSHAATVATLRVLQVWKGEVPTWVQTSPHLLSLCDGCEFVVGECYLIHADRDRLRPNTVRCSTASLLESVRHEMAFLRRFADPPSREMVSGVCDSIRLEMFARRETLGPEQRIEMARSCMLHPDLSEQVIPFLMELSQSPHEEERAAAVKAFVMLADNHPAVLPRVVAALTDGSPIVHREARRLQGRSWALADTVLIAPLVALLDDPREESRCAAAELLGSMGLLAAHTLPILEAATTRGSPGEMARMAAAARSLRNDLNHLEIAGEECRSDDPRTRAMGHTRLAMLEPIPPALTGLVPPPSPSTERARVGTHDTSTRATLSPDSIRECALARLESADNDPDSCARAVRDLAGARPTTCETVALLVTLLNDDSCGIRRATAGALARVDSCHAQAVEGLRGVLRGDDPLVAMVAARSLGVLSLRTETPAPIFRQWHADGHFELLAQAQEGLRQVANLYRFAEEVSAGAVPLLEAYLRDRDPRVRQRGARLLGRVWSDPTAAVQVLTRCVTDEDTEVRRLVADALADFACLTPRAEGALIDLLQDPDARVRQSAAIGLGALGPAAVNAIPALERLSDAEGQTPAGRQAEQALQRIRNR